MTEYVRKYPDELYSDAALGDNYRTGGQPRFDGPLMSETRRLDADGTHMPKAEWLSTRGIYSIEE